MPFQSENQRKAMYSAASGHSTLGIPQSVAKKFIAHASDTDNLPRHAAGTIYVAPDGDILLLRRSKDEANFPNHWALPGGGMDEGETPEQTAEREAREEMGNVPEAAMPRKLVDARETPTGMIFHTFAQGIPKFHPQLNGEHNGYGWFALDDLPSPMHPAVYDVLCKQLGMAADMEPEDWESLKENFVKWVSEEEAEAEHEEGTAQDSFAMDRATVRSVDADGHLHVSTTPITRACVSPYYGREIPNASALGLDPEKIYQVYRDKDELKKGAETFVGKPVLMEHVPTSADNHPRDLTVGAIGGPVKMEGDTLYAPLTIWDQMAIDAIESEEKKNLSCAYRYRYDPKPGTAPNGEHFDGRMVEIEGNHIALVVEPRVPGSVVADSAIVINTNTKSEANMANKLAAKKAKMAAALKGVLAQDAKLEDVLKTLMALDAEKEDMPKNKAEDEEEDDKEEAKEKAMDADEEEDKKKAEDGDEEDEKAMDAEEKEEMVSKKAMDAAIKANAAAVEAKTIKRLNAIASAREAVSPYVGSLPGAFDSADAVYRAALMGMGMDVSTVKEVAALEIILKSQPLPGSQKSKKPAVAMDAKATDGFFELFPNAPRSIKSL